MVAEQILKGGRYIFLGTGLVYGFFNNQLYQYSAKQKSHRDEYNRKVKSIQQALEADAPVDFVFDEQ